MKNTKLYNPLCFKNVKRVILLLFISLGLLSSCSDLLDENPKSVSDANFYNTAEEVETAVNAVYETLGDGYIRAEQIVILDTHTDWGYGRGSRANYNDFAGFNSANINNAGTRWKNFYLGIRNANIVIKNAPNGSSISQDDINEYVAEARFLRALCYFDLVRNWSGVPLRTEKNMEERDVAKSTADAIYDFIIEDALYAEEYLPETQSDIGRATKYAAKMLLADVYLNLEEYSKAQEKALDVIESGLYSLVPSTSTSDLRTNLFGPDIKTSTEEIFYFKYIRQDGYGNWILWVLNHTSSGYFNYGGAYAHYSRSDNPFIQNWNDTDLRKGFWDQIDFGLGSETLVCNKYSDTEAVAKSRGAGNDLPIYRYAEALLFYAEASCMASNGPTEKGVECLNQVHRRAYGLDAETASDVDFNIADYDAESFQDLILQERAYEFIFEGKRWYDLKRTGKAAEVILAAKGITIQEIAYLWPIPDSELDYNQALDPATDQNPGY